MKTYSVILEDEIIDNRTLLEAQAIAEFHVECECDGFMRTTKWRSGLWRMDYFIFEANGKKRIIASIEESH